MHLPWIKNRALKKIGYRQIVIGRRFFGFGGDEYVIKPITSIDILGARNGLPLSFLKINDKTESGQSMYEQAMDGIDKAKKEADEVNDQQILKLVHFFLSHGVVSKNRKKCDINKLPLSVGYVLSNHIMRLSFRLFDSVVEVTKTDVYSTYNMAKLYGQRPVEIIANGRDYTDLDAYMVDFFVSAIGTEIEQKEMEKEMAKARRARGTR